MSSIKQPRQIIKVDVLVKTGQLSTTKLEFENSKAILHNNYLMVETCEENFKTTKLFNISEVVAFKEYYNITP